MKALTTTPASVLLLGLLLVCFGETGLRAQTPALGQALDATNLVWTTGGDAAWFGQSTNTHDGFSAAQSGAVGPGQTSWLETTVVGPATLSYWSEVLDASYGSSLTLAINPALGLGGGVLAPRPRGWASSIYDLPVGTNVLHWSFYRRSDSLNATAAGFLDQVAILPPRPLQLSYQPQDETVFCRQNAGFSVSAIGTPPFSYQWLKDGTNLLGATNSYLSILSATTNEAGSYCVLVTNIQGSVSSTNALLTVLPPAPPSITYQPQDTTAYVGQSVYLSPWVDGSPPFGYQWLKNNTNIVGAVDSYLLLANIQLEDAGVYSLQVTNTEGSALSSNAVLTVLPDAAPVITCQPASIAVAAGGLAILTVGASGGPPPQCYWFKNGSPLPSGNFSNLTFSAVSSADAGVYSVLVSNLAGSVSSHEAILTVIPALSPRGSWFQGVYDVAVTNDLVYVAQGSDGVGVLSVSDPDAPVMLGGYNTSGDACAVRLAGNLAYVADGYSGLEILSLTNPIWPVKLGNYNTPGYAQDVCLAGHLACIADSTSGLQIVDVSNPVQPILVGSFLITNMSATSVQVSGDRAYVGCATGLQILDISNPAQPVLLGITSNDASGIDVVGNLALTAGSSSGLNIFDISNPTAPILIGSYFPPYSANPPIGPLPFPPILPYSSGYDVRAADNLAYMAFGTYGLLVMDVSNPSVPACVASFTTTGSAQRVSVAGNRAYVAMGDGGLQIIDVTPGLGVQPSPALALVSEDRLKLTLTGPISASFSVEFIDNLGETQWQPLQTVTLTNAPAILELPTTPAANRFFRARLLQP